MKIKNFIAGMGLTMKIKEVFENPNMSDPKWEAKHYQIKIENGKKSMITYFSQGIGITHMPTLADVLDCLATDAQCGSETFEDFCANLGYDNDSIKALNTFNAISKQSKELKELLGNDAYKALLEDVERL